MEEKNHTEHKEDRHNIEHKGEHIHHAHHEHLANKKHIRMKKSALWMLISGILAVVLVISIYTGGFKGGGGSAGGTISAQEASDKAVAYINTNLMQPGTSATVKSVEDSGDLYNVKLDIGGREFDSYVTKDGGLLFPSAVDLSVEIEAPAEPTEQPPAPIAEKSDKPSVELFVMSHCPFGTQAEKGMIPVAELLGDKIDFEIKFVNYVMHGETEVNEQLNQHCIKTEQGDKFLPYLKCFLKAGDGEACLSETAIDEDTLKACAEKTDAEFKITESLENPTGRYPAFLINDEECKAYGISGSPSLVINGMKVNSARSPSAYLATICSAFNEAPEECEEELSTANPSSGFGFKEGNTADTAAAQCG